MRSTTSSSDIKTIVRDNFKKFWTVPAFGLFWFLVWGLIPILLRSSENSLLDISSLSYNESLGYPFAILFIPVLSGMTVFSYLQNPSAANYIHSLPLSRQKLFGANVLSGLAMVAAPIVINGIIMCICAGNLMFVKWMIITFICCAAIFAITVFAAMISGNVLMHLFNAIFFNCVLTLLLLVFVDVCDSMLLGYESPDGLMSFILRSNALTATIGEAARIPICLVYLAVAVIVMLIAWAIYKRRPIERSGSSVIFPWTRTLLFLICVFSGALLIGLLNAMIMSDNSLVKFDHNMIIGMIIGALIVFVIGSVLIDRSAKIFTRRNVLPAAIALALVLAVSGGVSADVIGYNNNVPSVGDVRTACLDAENSVLFNTYDDDWESGFRYLANYYNDVNDFEKMGDAKYPAFSSEESIKAITDLQRSLINQETEGMTYIDDVSIVYELNNGKVIRRNYDIFVPTDSEGGISDVDPNVREVTAELYDSEEFKTVYSLKNLKDDYFEKGSVMFNPNPYGEESEYIPISTKDAKSLKVAMEKDFQKLSYGDYLESSGLIEITRNGKTDDDEYYDGDVLEIPISTKAYNTRDWLLEHGIKVK